MPDVHPQGLERVSRASKFFAVLCVLYIMGLCVQFLAGGRILVEVYFAGGVLVFAGMLIWLGAIVLPLVSVFVFRRSMALHAYLAATACVVIAVVGLVRAAHDTSNAVGAI